MLLKRAWVYRLYSIINPAKSIYVLKKNKNVYIKYATIIINKVYLSISFMGTLIFSKKLRIVLLFFFSKFKEEKNIEFL